MRVAYYTFPALFDASLPLIAEMGQRSELHVLLQFTPDCWQTNLFDTPVMPQPSGLHPALPLLKTFPSMLRPYWQSAASIQMAVFGGGASNLHTALRTFQFLSQLKPDVIHFETTPGCMGWMLPLLRRLAPVVITVRDAQPNVDELPWPKRLARWWMYRQTDRFILQHRAQLSYFCQSSGVAPERVVYIPLGSYDLYRAWAVPRVQEDAMLVLFLGRLSAYQGLQDLLAAAPLVCQQVPGAHFLIAGQPSPAYSLPSLPVLPAAGRLELIGRRLSNAELAQLFQQASLVVCPYRDASRSGVLLTAYAFGKPVVATRVGGLPEYVTDGETGLLVPPGDPELLAAAIARVLKDIAAGGRDSYRRAVAHKCAQDLSWNQIARQTLQVYLQAQQHMVASQEELTTL